MTDLHHGYIVILKDELREDDADESIITALKCIKGVIDVKPLVTDYTSVVAESRVRHEMQSKFRKFMKDW